LSPFIDRQLVEEQIALRAYLFSAICLGNCYRMPFAALLGEMLESKQFPMTEQIALRAYLLAYIACTMPAERP